MTGAGLLIKVPSFQSMIWPVLRAIRSLGGSGNKAKIYDRLVIREGYTPAQLQRLNTKATEPEIRARLSWALSDLKAIGALSRTARTWQATVWGASVGEEELVAEFKRFRKQRAEGAARSRAAGTGTALVVYVPPGPLVPVIAAVVPVVVESEADLSDMPERWRHLPPEKQASLMRSREEQRVMRERAWPKK